MGFLAGEQVFKVQGGDLGVTFDWGMKLVQWWLVPERVGQEWQGLKSVPGSNLSPGRCALGDRAGALTLVLMFLARPA